MKIDEFLDAATRYQRGSFWVCLVPTVGALLCLFAYMQFADSVASAAAKRFGEPASKILGVLPMVPIVIVAFGIMIPLSRRLEREFGIPCPHCGKGLAAGKSIVVASKHCPHCGKRVIEFSQPET